LSQAVKALVSSNGFENELREEESTTKHAKKDLEAMLSLMSGSTENRNYHKSQTMDAIVGVVEVC